MFKHKLQNDYKLQQLVYIEKLKGVDLDETDPLNEEEGEGIQINASTFDHLFEDENGKIILETNINTPRSTLHSNPSLTYSSSAKDEISRLLHVMETLNSQNQQESLK